jgi:hypothetical protein
MEEEKRDIINSISTAITVVLFLLLLSAFSDKSSELGCGASRHQLQSELQSDCTMAVLSATVQIPSFHKSIVVLPGNFINEYPSIVVYNETISHNISVILRTRLLIKPESICRFYYHFFSGDAEDIPVLS